MALTLILEDGTGKPDANSYASLEEFAEYAEAHLYADAHTNATDPKRAAALVMATRVIDAQMEFVGQRAGSTQRLEWPRLFLGDGRGIPTGYVMGQATAQPFEGQLVPRRLKDATCELAMALMDSNRTADADTAGIAELGLGQGALSIKFDKADRPGVLPELVQRFLEPLGRQRGRGGVVRVVRA